MISTTFRLILIIWMLVCHIGQAQSAIGQTPCVGDESLVINETSQVEDDHSDTHQDECCEEACCLSDCACSGSLCSAVVCLIGNPNTSHKLVMSNVISWQFSELPIGFNRSLYRPPIFS